MRVGLESHPCVRPKPSYNFGQPWLALPTIAILDRLLYHSHVLNNKSAPPRHGDWNPRRRAPTERAFPGVVVCRGMDHKQTNIAVYHANRVSNTGCRLMRKIGCRLTLRRHKQDAAILRSLVPHGRRRFPRAIPSTFRPMTLASPGERYCGIASCRGAASSLNCSTSPVDCEYAQVLVPRAR